MKTCGVQTERANFDKKKMNTSTIDMNEMTKNDSSRDIAVSQLQLFFEPVTGLDWRLLGLNLLIVLFCLIIGFFVWIPLRLIVPYLIRRRNKVVSCNLKKSPCLPTSCCVLQIFVVLISLNVDSKCSGATFVDSSALVARSSFCFVDFACHETTDRTDCVGSK